MPGLLQTALAQVIDAVRVPEISTKAKDAVIADDKIDIPGSTMEEVVALMIGKSRLDQATLGQVEETSAG